MVGFRLVRVLLVLGCLLLALGLPNRLYAADFAVSCDVAELVSAINAANGNGERGIDSRAGRGQRARVPLRVAGLRGGGGATYFYWLEVVDFQGNLQRFGPASATLGSPTALALSQISPQPRRASPLIPPLLGGLAIALIWRVRLRKKEKKL